MGGGHCACICAQRGQDNGWSSMSSPLCRLMFSPPAPDLGLPCPNVIRIRVQDTGSRTRLHNFVRIGLQPNLSYSLLTHPLAKVCPSHITCSRSGICGWLYTGHNVCMYVRMYVCMSVCVVSHVPYCHFHSLHLLAQTVQEPHHPVPASVKVVGGHQRSAAAMLVEQHTSVGGRGEGTTLLCCHSAPSGCLPPTHCSSE